MNTSDHPSVAKVAAALIKTGQHTSAAKIRFLPAEVRTAVQAADALGVEVGAIANSLIFRQHNPGSEDTPLLALTSGAHRANLDTLASLTDVAEISQADPAFVKHHTGQAIGGVSPLGHPQQLATVVDIALKRYDIIWAAAGHPRSVFPTTFNDLLQITGGHTGDIAASLSENSIR